MDFRLLEYFLAVAREQNITTAAESLHISQPALSTQLKNLEEELGKQLLIRGVKGSRKVLLTEEGMILRKRAEEMLLLKKRTEEEISGSNEIIAGNVFIGTGETETVRLFAQVAKKTTKKNIRISDITYLVEMQNMFLNIWIKESLILGCYLEK
ncbi:Transcriptional regulator [Faecalitalea cylindroides T2-87]|uniref:Transcriptional regulator n=1 Tax=Faecalitalea cylindroides T2-87 TaxID=717960 RepID=D4JFN9_9FIRM|nr:Transcriptional regulator [Faecalitalea cylindroides T2-87]